MARCAGGNAPNITASHIRGSVVLVSGQCGVPQWPGSTRLSRGVGQQRGHVSPPVAALGGNGTSPLYLVRCSVISASGHGGLPPCPRITKLSRVVRGFCSVRPLRPPASLLHNAALPSVSASRCAKAPLGAGHRLRALRVKATGVMQSGLRWSRSHSRRRSPFAFAPYAPPSARPCGCACTWALVRRSALCVWSVACGQSWGVCPRPPVGLAAARLWPRAGLPIRPPRGLPQSAQNRGQRR
jgi:hypothetical protein